MKFSKQLLLLICITSIQINASPANTMEYYENLINAAKPRSMQLEDYAELTRSAAIGFLDKIELIAHESGHAITAKILNGGQIYICLGYGKQQYLFRLGNIIIRGFDGDGETISNLYRIDESNTNKKIKIFLIKLMGPLFGICSLIIMKSFLKKLILKSNDSSFLNHYLKSLNCICTIRIGSEILYGLTPIASSKNGDGYQIWKLLDSDEKYIGKVPFRQISTFRDFMEVFKLA